MIGYATAQYLLKAMGGKGNVVILEGLSIAATSVDRSRGFMKFDSAASSRALHWQRPRPGAKSADTEAAD